MTVSFTVIHGLADGLVAIESAQAQNKTIDLITAPSASAYMGAGIFKAITDRLREQGGETIGNIFYDCGARSGDVLAGLRIGLKQFCLAPEAITPALADLAAQYGATLMPRPESL